MPNRLAGETSPYLLQHKDNPVDWYPWGEEALRRARDEDRPVLLSVGYSACHWCHVMERESFEDEAIARLMNERFVNVKVDREERPDIDAIYMQAVQAMTGRGGWPMTVFLLPDGTPFYGGTYYPPEDRHGMPGFPRVLQAVSEAYRERRADLFEHGRQLVRQIEATAKPPPSPSPLSDDLLHNAASQLRHRYDPRFGGFGGAPKFPNPMDLALILRYHHRFGDPELLAMALHTLRAMAAGGIYDQVGGGFHRYSTDERWLVPHFEKMLYDNAQLAGVYLDAYLVTGDALFAQIARETLDYVLREMTHQGGGFFSTQDADSEGEEGRFFLWTPAEIDTALGDEAALVREYYGVTDAGNFEGRTILHVPVDLVTFAAARGLDATAFDRRLGDARCRLYEARERRIHPARDEKVLTAWNGMMLRAFARASRVLDDPDRRYRQAAVRNAGFLLASMRPTGRLLRSWKDGNVRLLGYLEDYASLADGLLATYEATFDPRYFREAIDLAREMLDLFWDVASGGFYDSGSDHEALVVRPHDFFDNATPAGNSVAVDVLLRLAVLTGDGTFERTATAVLQGLAPYLEGAPAGFGRLLGALDFHLGRKQELAVVWEGKDEPQALLDVAFQSYRPALIVAGGTSNRDATPSPLLAGRTLVDGKPTAYVCEHYVCGLPVTDADALAAQLA